MSEERGLMRGMFQGQGGTLIPDGHCCYENTKAALSERCKKSSHSEGGDLWPQVFTTSSKASVV